MQTSNTGVQTSESIERNKVIIYNNIYLTAMNASHLNEEPISLKQAVEEQLDLILKLEEDRKALKK